MAISKDILDIIAGLKTPVELPDLGIDVIDVEPEDRD